MLILIFLSGTGRGGFAGDYIKLSEKTGDREKNEQQ